MDVDRLLFLLTTVFLSAEVSGLQMTIAPSTVTLNSPVQQGLTMRCDLDNFEKNENVYQFNVMTITRNSGRPGDPKRVAVMTGYNTSSLSQGSDMGQPLHNGMFKAKAGTTAQNEARLELRWEMSQVKCDFAGDYTCEVQWLEQGTFQPKTWSKTAPLAMKTTPQKPQVQLIRNGIPVTPQPTNQTIASSYPEGDVLDLECSSNIGSSKDKTIKWLRTRRFGINIDDLMVANDGTSTTITDDTMKNCTYHQISMFKISVTADKFQTGSNKMLFLCEIDDGLFPLQPLQSQKIYIQLENVLSGPERSEESTQVSAGVIAGGVVAGIAVIVIVAVVVFALGRKFGNLAKKDKDNEDDVGPKEIHQQTLQERNENYDNIVSGSASSEAVNDSSRNVYEQLDPALKKERVYSAVHPTNENIKLDDAGAKYINLNEYTP